jgi:hypothetical protein
MKPIKSMSSNEKLDLIRELKATAQRLAFYNFADHLETLETEFEFRTHKIADTRLSFLFERNVKP